jgi:hypothetical protein
MRTSIFHSLILLIFPAHRKAGWSGRPKEEEWIGGYGWMDAVVQRANRSTRWVFWFSCAWLLLATNGLISSCAHELKRSQIRFASLLVSGHLLICCFLPCMVAVMCLGALHYVIYGPYIQKIEYLFSASEEGGTANTHAHTVVTNYPERNNRFGKLYGRQLYLHSSTWASLSMPSLLATNKLTRLLVDKK